MSISKYQQYYQKMIDQNHKLFDQFARIHALYQIEPDKHQQDFHKIGMEVLDLVRDWERRLCAAMGKGQFASYSHRLAEKFWSLVRQDFSLIDQVGVKKICTKDEHDYE